MKRLSSILIVTSVVLLAACSQLPLNGAVSESGEKANASMVERKSGRIGGVRIQDAAGSAVLQKVEFRPGVSSTTVERLARHSACTGGKGAGLITEKGPIEVYRMQCDNGASFLARCELRQCQPMR